MIPIQRVFQAAQRHPTRPALQTPTGTLTYTELVRWVTAVRLAIRREEARFGHQQCIGLVADDSPWAYAAMLALMAERSAYVPLNKKNPEARNLAIIEDAGIQVVFVSQKSQFTRQLQLGSPEVRSVVALSELEVPARPDYTFSEPFFPRNLAYLLFTSGSTGRPKGVPIHTKELQAFVEAVVDSGLYHFTPEDRFLQMFELTFDLSVFSYLVPLCVGACVCVVPEEGIGSLKVYETLEDASVSVALLVPSVLAHLRPYFHEVDLPKLRYSLFCGEALPHALAAEWAKCVPQAQVENLYGPTEATVFCTRYVFEAQQAAVEQHHGGVPIGKPLPGTDVCVRGEDGQALPEGQSGELCLMGPQVAEGYWHNPEKTADQFITIDHRGQMRSAYRTGDFAIVNPYGNYLFLGRADTQLKVEGFRVELGEIEHHVRAFLQSGLCAVVPQTDENGHTALHLFVESRGGLVDTGQLMDYLKEQLPAYMLPRTVNSLPDLPLNLNGKIDRPGLKKLLP